MRKSIHLGIFAACLASFSPTQSFAQHCQPYWTAQYKCAMGCGPCGGSRTVAPQYVAPQPSAAQIAARRATALNDKGVSAEKADNLTLAVSLYEQALQLNPNSQVIRGNLAHARAVALNNQGVEADRRGDWALAIRLLEQALQVMPKDKYYEVPRNSLRKNIANVRARMQEQARQEEQKRSFEELKRRVVSYALTGPAKNINNEWTCPADLPQLAFNPARATQPDSHYCIGKDAVACGGPSKSWGCKAGYSCNGDGSDPAVALCR